MSDTKKIQIKFFGWPFSVNRFNLREILKKDRVCAYCSGALNPKTCTLDHITPKARIRLYPEEFIDLYDGANLTASCENCNHEKSCKKLMFFLFERFSNGKKV